jgi:hypothetical protein
MLKRLLVIIFWLLIPITCSIAQNESLTITTYYPSPYGVYRCLKLNPTTEPTGTAVSRGVIYYDIGFGTIRYRNGTDEWANITDVISAPKQCHQLSFTSSSGSTLCPLGYYTNWGVALTAGIMLCCQVDNP